MVRLVPMTAEEFADYWKQSVTEYAEEHVQAGNWHPAEALQNAERQYRHLLPEGLATKSQFLYTIMDGETGDPVGILWFALVDKSLHPYAFIYDFWIKEAQRRKGYATQALSVLEEKVHQMGLNEIKLHAFAHNQAAIALYQKTGFVITDINMSKKLSP